jgi:Tol biopolymer transport system component/predicted Ser/Thr protein kinase
MALPPGTRLGAYEILSALGAGGMGEVYKARDTRLDRAVAIKILPSADPALKARFEREAKAIASLQHPHICTLHDVGHQGGTDYLVMEYLEGETLAARVTRGPVKLNEALKIAVEIAEALDKAHRAGIVHRDLKPANIMLTKSGVKVLDFGLAKLESSIAPSSLSGAPTVEISQLTEGGVILGTLRYMSPEQVSGSKADYRSDIWAFGCIVYEMVTGRKAFGGMNQATLAATILRSDPEPIEENVAVARSLEWVLSRCLAKEPDDRWQTVHDLLAELRRTAADIAVAAHVPLRAPPRLFERGVWIVLTGIALAAAILATIRTGRERVAEFPVQLSIVPPQGLEFPGYPGSPFPAISPDGHRVAFVVTQGGRTLLAVRSLDSLQIQMLSGTDDARLPFWSPDGRLIGFFAQGKLKKIDLVGGPAETICDAPTGAQGATWNSDGVILFAPSSASGLLRVATTGGRVTSATTPDQTPGEGSHQWPFFLPDGEHFLFTVRRPTALPTAFVYVGSLASPERIQLTSTDSKALYAAGYLLFTKAGFLLAQPFDIKHFKLTGEPQRLAENLPANAGRVPFAVSNDVIAYRPGVSNLLSRLTWFDRTGRSLGVVAGTDTATYQGIALSQDGKRLAMHVHEPVGGDLWVTDNVRGVTSRLTFDPKLHYSSPTWSADGSSIAFANVLGLHQRTSDGVGGDHLLIKATTPFTLSRSWSRDGQRLLFEALDPVTNWDISAVPLFGDRKPFYVLRTSANEMLAQFSPDGRFMAYQSDESGRFEIYVQTFPPSGSKWQISRGGGAHARWRPEGKELYFIAPEEKLMAVDVKIEGDRLSSGTPVPLFDIHPAMSSGPVTAYVQYDVMPDGGRFVVATLSAPQPRPLTVVLNWVAALKK